MFWVMMTARPPLAVMGGVLGVMLAFSLLSPSMAWARASSAKIHQEIAALERELDAFHAANLSHPLADPGAPPLTQRQPRHVYQKAREVFVKVQKLRGLHQLETRPVPLLAPREVALGDVHRLVKAIRTDLDGLRPAYKVTAIPGEDDDPAQEGTPSDLYAALDMVSRSLDGLGLARQMPNDVLQVALTIIGELEAIRQCRGLAAPPAVAKNTEGKQPKDNYARAFALHQALKTLSESSERFAIPDGVRLLNPRTGPIRPEHVLDLLNNVLADVIALKARLGVRHTLPFAPTQSGATPSHVYDALSLAIVLIETMA
ncbi:MAG: hypothetical protein ACOY99_06925 [Pseudomonadota bacterium]